MVFFISEVLTPTQCTNQALFPCCHQSCLIGNPFVNQRPYSWSTYPLKNGKQDGTKDTYLHKYVSNGFFLFSVIMGGMLFTFETPVWCVTFICKNNKRFNIKKTRFGQMLKVHNKVALI